MWCALCLNKAFTRVDRRRGVCYRSCTRSRLLITIGQLTRVKMFTLFMMYYIAQCFISRIRLFFHAVCFQLSTFSRKLCSLFFAKTLLTPLSWMELFLDLLAAAYTRTRISEKQKTRTLRHRSICIHQRCVCHYRGLYK